MDFELDYDEENTVDSREATDVELPRPPVCKKNKEILEKYAPIYQEDYHEFKKSFLKWLLTKGKSPQKREGYSETTVIQTHYKIEETYRWVWSNRGEYTKTFGPDDATEFLEYLQERAGKGDNYRDYIQKSVKRLFNYWRDSDNKRIEEWDHDIEISTDHGNSEKKGHDRFRPHEFQELYDAAIGLNAVKSYHNRNMTSDERDRIKIMLAQRFGKPKNEIGPEDFKRANSWKIPSLIAVTMDTGLHP